MNKSRIRAAENAKTRVMFETRHIKRQLESAIAQSWASILAAREGVTASKAQVQAAELALEGVELEREVGTRSALDVLNVNQELLEARLLRLDSQNAVHKASYNLLVLTGGFDAVSMSLPTEIYNPDNNFNNIIDESSFNIIDDILPEKWR